MRKLISLFTVLALAAMLFGINACAQSKPKVYTRLASALSAEVVFTVDVAAYGNEIKEFGVQIGKYENNLSSWISFGSTKAEHITVSKTVTLPAGMWRYRAYAILDSETVTGDTFAVNVPDGGRPAVSTGATLIDNGNTVFKFGVAPDGNDDISACGVLFGITPTDLNRKKSVSEPSYGEHSVTVSLPGGTWYYRAYAQNEYGLALGNIRKVYIPPEKAKIAAKLLDVPHFRQSDGRWINVAINRDHRTWEKYPTTFLAPGCTNMNYGCWFVSECMLYDYMHSTDLNPEQYRKVRYLNGTAEEPLYVEYDPVTWKLVYSEISAGNPVIIWGWAEDGEGHAAVIVGYEDVSDIDNISPYVFTVNNPWYDYSTSLRSFLSDWPDNLQLVPVSRISNFN